MTLDSIQAGLIGLGIAAAAVFNGWQAYQARRAANGARNEAGAAKDHASTAADYSKPVSNGFTAHVRESLAEILVVASEARDQATRANDKIDRHLQAHADAHLQAVPTTRIMRG